MAKTCLNKLGTNIATTCDMPVHGVKALYLMHVEDITYSASSDASWASVAFDTDAKSYKVEGYKQNIQVTTAVRSLDASNKLDVTVMFKSPSSHAGRTIETNFMRSILTGKFYVAVVNNDSSAFIVGAQSPLECSGLDWDSNANGCMRTYTLTAPDGSAGNYITGIASAALATIISKA